MGPPTQQRHYSLVLRKVHHQSSTGPGHGTQRREGIWDLAAYQFSPYLISGEWLRSPWETQRQGAGLSLCEQKRLLEMIGSV